MKTVQGLYITLYFIRAPWGGWQAEEAGKEETGRRLKKSHKTKWRVKMKRGKESDSLTVSTHSASVFDGIGEELRARDKDRDGK